MLASVRAVTLATGWGAATHNAIVLAEIECVACGERPVSRCGWCHELTVDEHEDCASAAAEVERRERDTADYEDACERRGDELREARDPKTDPDPSPVGLVRLDRDLVAMFLRDIAEVKQVVPDPWDSDLPWDRPWGRSWWHEWPVELDDPLALARFCHAVGSIRGYAATLDVTPNEFVAHVEAFASKKG